MIRALVVLGALLLIAVVAAWIYDETRPEHDQWVPTAGQKRVLVFAKYLALVVAAVLAISALYSFAQLL